ncbi:hypothetical protein AVEN_101780-1 [Araneus ventricosus]|uniref:Uncharacterized protein n=1 Tax=Araneus ventricosus TaxID=182803 RepID=A0A4Y2D164_ARAVE|nr:hypothetical protein AVEN_101780-1 [Araneus ventricosus]
MSNKVFFSCTGSDVMLCFSYFSRKLWIVQERFFGQFLCTPNEESSCAEFMPSFWDTLYKTLMWTQNRAEFDNRRLAAARKFGGLFTFESAELLN